MPRGNLGAGSPTNQKDLVEDEGLQGRPKISKKTVYWKKMKTSVFERVNLLGFWVRQGSVPVPDSR